MKKSILATLALFAVTGLAQAAPVQTVNTSIGDVLAGENGMTLYTFRKDAGGVSNCYDACATNWPPLFANDGDKADAPYSIVERKDGTKQWAKDGKPLYFWVKDAKQGDTTGQGVKDAWDAARP